MDTNVNAMPATIHAMSDFQLADIIRRFVCRRPGLEPQVHIRWSYYRRAADRAKEQRLVALHWLHEAECRPQAMQYVREMLQAHDRLSYRPTTGTLHYATDGDWSAEYRVAIADVLRGAVERAQQEFYAHCAAVRAIARQLHANKRPQPVIVRRIPAN